VSEQVNEMRLELDTLLVTMHLIVRIYYLPAAAEGHGQ
jgi:hypothetical protein